MRADRANVRPRRARTHVGAKMELRSQEGYRQEDGQNSDVTNPAGHVPYKTESREKWLRRQEVTGNCQDSLTAYTRAKRPARDFLLMPQRFEFRMLTKHSRNGHAIYQAGCSRRRSD